MSVDLVVTDGTGSGHQNPSQMGHIALCQDPGITYSGCEVGGGGAETAVSQKTVGNGSPEKSGFFIPPPLPLASP